MTDGQPEFIVKGDLTANFSQILNATICDKRLSYRARGIHHYLLSKPKDWRALLADIVNQSDPDGKDSVTVGLNELEALGYLKRVERSRVEGRFAGYDIFVYGSPDTETEIPLRLLPGETPNTPDHTGTAEPAPVNPLLQIKNNKDTKKDEKRESEIPQPSDEQLAAELAADVAEARDRGIDVEPLRRFK